MMDRRVFLPPMLNGIVAGFVLSVFLLISTPAPAAAETQPAGAPAVKKVVLYKHGMGYIERQGTIRDEATVSLFFRAGQMKDLLTSFYAVDLDGGKITSIQYDTKDPIAKRLQDILITIPENAALSQFLVQLKGARVSVKSAGETVEGRILGVEPVSEIVDGRTVKSGYRLVLMTDAGPIRSLDLYALSEFTVVDENLDRDLKRLLDITLESKHTDRKKLTVTAVGKGERDLRIGYLIEMPIWKTSYRVLFDSKDKDKALVQGYALAENTTEDDWNEVSVSFVAGNPLSYVMDLYSPFYVTRPQVPIPGLEHLRVAWGAAPPPAVTEEKVYAKEEVYRRAKKAAPAAAPLAEMEMALDLAEPAEDLTQLMAASVGAAAAGVSVGELFSYRAEELVTIPRGQAAMVPILSQPMKGRRLLFYKRAFSPKPVNAWNLNNDTDLTLEAGAVTFFEGSTSLGEGILSHTLPPGSEEVLPFAVDASVDVIPQIDSQRQPFFKGKVVDGVLWLSAEEILTTTWKITNRGEESQALWIDHPKNPAYKLSKPQKSLKEVDNHYRFEIALKASETVDFAVEERREVWETINLGSADETTIRFYAAAKYLSPAVRAFLKDLGDILAIKASLMRQIKEWGSQAQRLMEEQSRLRSNIDRTRTNIPREQELRAKWMNALSVAEDKLVDLRVQLDEADRKIRELEEKIAAAVRGFKEE